MQAVTSIAAVQQNSGQSAVQPKLVHAAHEFEAQMMKELLRPLTSTNSSLDGDEDEDGADNALGEYAGEALAGALSSHGGFGIADQIVKDLSRSGK